ncbi:unnamed protein product [Meganyctiphanes norvegica]|uniref:Anion exchange protein n=1 Tax=Meganyctiphanes norvegica TaxID=48144 RepID=A0AAV2RBL0_MEGNR
MDKDKMDHLQVNDGNLQPLIVKQQPPLVRQESETDLTPKRDPLTRQGKLFAGLIDDFKIRLSQYPSDLKDGINGQVAAGAIFIYFASLSASITFGGLYGDATDKWIGVGETLLLTAVNGIIMALFASQPLLIVGATGPLMIFDLALYNFCKSNDIELLPMRFWIGFWMTVTGLIFGAFELVSVVKKFSRFTEEIFSTLVCIIFIYEAFNKLSQIFVRHPLLEYYAIPTEKNITEALSLGNNLTDIDDFTNKTLEVDVAKEIPQPNTSLISLIIMIGTFLIATKLKEFRNSRYFGRLLRRMLGDFGVPLSIVLMVGLDVLLSETYTDKLTMPDGLSPSNPNVRGWLVNPFGSGGFPIWCIFAAAPASLLLFVLVFLEENICHLILGKPERKMKKGTGFHSDLFLSCFINLISGIFGAPFMTPAVVRTVSHTSALTVVASPGPGLPPKTVGVLEQRLSALLVAIMVGLSVLMAPVLNLVPKPVLFGIFLYMGVSSTAGIQFLERIFIMLMPVKYHPDVPYVTEMRTLKMHLYTVIQLILLIVLWVVKQSPAALCFPFILLMLIPIRMYIMPRIFDLDELDALDGSGAHVSAVAAKEEQGDNLDFYEEAHDFPTHVDDEAKEIRRKSIISMAENFKAVP